MNDKIIQEIKILIQKNKYIKQIIVTEMSHPNIPPNILERIEREKKDRTGKLYLSGLNLNLAVIFTELQNMDWLQELDLAGNRIDDIQLLRHLHNLEVIRLSDNFISDVSPLGRLYRLSHLHLSRNDIEDVTPLRELPNLKVLRLSGNKITDISPVRQLLKANPQMALSIYNNPLENPPFEIAMRGNQAILDWFDAKENEGVISNDQVKLILLGNSEVGKTSLARYLTTGEYDKKEKSTHGINRFVWKLKRENGTDFFANIWDFGGQMYYHATHRLFLTTNAVYAVVCEVNSENYDIKEEVMEDNGKKEIIDIEHHPYTYWLDSIMYHAQLKRNTDTISPYIIMVQSQCDLIDEAITEKIKKIEKGKSLKDTKDISIEEYLLSFTQDEKKKYGIGKYFYHISIHYAWLFNNTHLPIKTMEFARNFDSFRENLVKLLEKKMSKVELPANFPVIRDVLKDIARVKRRDMSADLTSVLNELNIAGMENNSVRLPVLEKSDYEAIVRRYSRSDDINFDILRTYLMDMVGSILHFADNPVLKDKVWIDPDWLHERIYTVLSKQVLCKEGRFTINDIKAALGNDNEEEAIEMAALLIQLQLVFEWKDGSGYVAPQYLPKHSARKEELEHTLAKEYKLRLTIQFPDFLPVHVISRIITQKGQDALSKSGFLWRNGIEYFERIEEQEERTILVASPAEKKINIYLHKNIPGSNARIILKDLAELIIENICEGNNDIALQLPGVEAIGWGNLCVAKKHNNTTAMSLDGNQLPVQPYLQLLPAFKHPPVKIFISYAHDDYDSLRVFLPELKQFIRTLEINHELELELFYDAYIPGGATWHEYIMEKVNERDILLCMVSQSFLDSTYINTNELGKTMEDIRLGKNVDVIPIYFRPCNLRDNKAVWNLLNWKPPGNEYFVKHTDDFAYTDLIWDAEGKLYSNPNRDRYMKNFVKFIEGNIVAKWAAKAGKKVDINDN